MGFIGGRLRAAGLLASGIAIAGAAQAQSGPAAPDSANNQATGAAVPASDPNLAPTAPPAEAGGGEPPAGTREIVVTGSRIARRDYVANSPIVTVQAQALENLSPVTLDNALQKLPQFTGINGQSTTGSGFGQTGAATLNLRNLGDNRNLVLLDGRRLQPSTTSFAVDINNIPSALIENVEVITGGASAVYGSDAVAGVINFKLRHNFEGLEIDAKKGISERGEYGSSDVSLLAGTNFGDDRGNVVVAFNYTNRGATFQRSTPFYQRALAKGTGAFAVSFLDLGYYQPEYEGVVALPGGGFGLNFPASGPVDFGFNTDHTTIFNVNTGAGYNSGVYPQNPYYVINNGVKFNANYNEYATTPLERYSGFGRVEYKLTDNISAFAQVLYTHYEVKNVFIPLPAANSWSVVIPRDAAHPIPASLAALLNTRPNPAAPWHLGRSLSFLGQPTTNNVNDTYQALVGLSGSFADHDWTWEIYGSHGDARVKSTGDQGYALLPTYRTLLQAPNYGAGYTGSGGTCTSGVSPFISQVSQDCIDLLTYRYTNRIRQKQDIAEANLQGKVTDLPAGELRVALGADYRRNTLTNDLDPAFKGDLSIDPTGFISSVVGNFAANSSRGSSSVYEFYGELLVPILKDLPLVRSFDIDAAYRYSNYRLSGGVSTYKADANWQVFDFLRIRGGYQRAVRAPNVTELFAAQQSRIVIPALDPCVNAGPFAIAPGNYGNTTANPDVAKVRALCTALTPTANPGLYNGGFVGSGTPVLVGQISGNPNAAAERANTYTLGAILSPKGLPLNSRLSLSADYYRISVSGAIAALDPNQSYQLCFNAFGTNPTYSATDPYCRTLVRAPGNGNPLGVNATYQNQGGIKTQGIDAQIDWAVPVGPGTLDLNAVGNYLLHYRISFAPGVPFVDYANTISSTAAYFRWRSLLTATYRMGPLDMGARWKHLPSARDSTCTGTCLAPPTAQYNLFDLFLAYDVNKTMRLTLGVDNLTDKEPPIVGGVTGNTNLGEYDIVGRQFYVAVRAKF